VRRLCAVATERIATFSAKLFVVAHEFCIVISVVYSSSDAGRGQPCDSVPGLLLAPRVLVYGLPSPVIIIPAIGAGLGEERVVGGGWIVATKLTLDMNITDIFIFHLQMYVK